MTFSDDQKKALAAKLHPSNVEQRSKAGQKLNYIEGWHAIAEANRIFGFDGWSRETLDFRCVSERDRQEENKQGWRVGYVARVRVTAGGVTRDGLGAGEGIDQNIAAAHESALKEAETDAMKRALMTFGNPFGLALYDKSGANVGIDEEAQQRAKAEQWTTATIGQVKKAPDLAWLVKLENSGAYEKLEAEHSDLHAGLAKAIEAKREALNAFQAPPKANGAMSPPEHLNGEAA